MFSVTSILLSNPSLAVINGRAYGEGEYLRPARAVAGAKRIQGCRPLIRGFAFAFRIMDGKVALQSLDGQSIVVPLRRDEVSAAPSNGAPEALLGDQ